MNDNYCYSILNKSIYTYNNDNVSNIYIFELELFDNDNASHCIRKLVKKNQGHLIALEDNIMYEPISHFNLTIININNLNNINICNGKITNNIIKCNNIYIHFIKSNNLLKCIYNIF
jgi:hypothetical protein